MKKYLIIISILLLITGCLFQEENEKGSLNIAVKWTDINKSVRILPENCTKIIVSLMQYRGGQYFTIKREVIRDLKESISYLKIEDIDTGEWEVSVSLKDSTDNYLTSIYKMVDIKQGENDLEAAFGLPQIPYPSTPYNNTIVTTDSSVVLGWQSIGVDFPTTSAVYKNLNSIKYYVYFGNNYNLTETDILNKDSTLISTQSGIFLQYYNIPVLEAGKTYYWKIKAENSEGSVESVVSTIKVKNNVPPPVLIAPIGTLANAALTKFSWSVSSDIEKDNQYTIYVTRYPLTGGNIESKIFPETGSISSTEYNLSSTEQSWFIAGYYYYWYVLINDLNGETQSTTGTFQIM